MLRSRETAVDLGWPWHANDSQRGLKVLSFMVPERGTRSGGNAGTMTRWEGEKRMTNHQSRRDFCATAIATIFASATSVRAGERKYDPGANDTEIKLGQTVPHSGPGSLYGVLGRVGEAYFQMINEQGGINGRKVTFLTLDDAYSMLCPCPVRLGHGNRIVSCLPFVRLR